MEEVLKDFGGKKIDVSCGTTAVFRGTVEEVGNGVLTMRDDDDKMLYVSIDKVTAFSECSEGQSRPGFIV